MDLDSRTLARELRIAFSQFAQGALPCPLFIFGCSFCPRPRASPAPLPPCVLRPASTSLDGFYAIVRARLLPVHLLPGLPRRQSPRAASPRPSRVSFPFLSFSAAL